MTEILPPDLHKKVAVLAAELEISVEEFIVQTVNERVEVTEFFRSRAGNSKPGDLTKILRAGPNRPPFPGDELPPDVAEKWAAEKKMNDDRD